MEDAKGEDCLTKLANWYRIAFQQLGLALYLETDNNLLLRGKSAFVDTRESKCWRLVSLSPRLPLDWPHSFYSYIKVY
jgi:hypothetical protein